MSATEHLEVERAERPVLLRTFETEFTVGDGRTVDVRVVPYDVEAHVSDDGGRTVYREVWDQAAFDDQLVHVMRLIEQDGRLAPRDLLVAPVRELRRDDRVDVHADLRVAQKLDGVAMLLQHGAQIVCGHISSCRQ
jgi:hypothetical protein